MIRQTVWQQMFQYAGFTRIPVVEGNSVPARVPQADCKPRETAGLLPAEPLNPCRAISTPESKPTHKVPLIHPNQQLATNLRLAAVLPSTVVFISRLLNLALPCNAAHLLLHKHAEAIHKAMMAPTPPGFPCGPKDSTYVQREVAIMTTAAAATNAAPTPSTQLMLSLAPAAAAAALLLPLLWRFLCQRCCCRRACCCCWQHPLQ